MPHEFVVPSVTVHADARTTRMRRSEGEFVVVRGGGRPEDFVAHLEGESEFYEGDNDVLANFPALLTRGLFSVGAAPTTSLDLVVLSDGIEVSFGGETTLHFEDMPETAFVIDPAQYVTSIITFRITNMDSDAFVFTILGRPI
jgi:hypothetical protein